MIKNKLETTQNIKAPGVSNVITSKYLPYTKLKTFKKVGVKTWTCPFPECRGKVFTHKDARPTLILLELT